MNIKTPLASGLTDGGVTFEQVHTEIGGFVKVRLSSFPEVQ